MTITTTYPPLSREALSELLDRYENGDGLAQTSARQELLDRGYDLNFPTFENTDEFGRTPEEAAAEDGEED
jgi:hypothetical protein